MFFICFNAAGPLNSGSWCSSGVPIHDTKWEMLLSVALCAQPQWLQWDFVPIPHLLFLSCPFPPLKKKKVCITVWYGWETFWYNHTQALSMIDLPDCLDPFWPCCLQFSCTADKMLCQQTAGPACTESFERGKWGKAGQEISQPSAFHQETNVK